MIDEQSARQEHAQLVKLLAERAYRQGSFTLSSGATSDFYLDVKQATYSPYGARLVGRAMLDLMRRFNVEAVGGLTMGADAVVSATVLTSAIEESPIPGFVVRKQPKMHGLSKWIEGIEPGNLRVAIVDDVVTTGNSILKAADRVRELGAEVVLVSCVVDREQGGKRRLELDVPEFVPLCTISEIKRAASNLMQSV